LEKAEARVTDCEARLSAIRAQLEDPAVYATHEGAARAQTLGKELEIARVELDRAYADWEAASEATGKDSLSS
jgi:hypothetical protein